MTIQNGRAKNLVSMANRTNNSGGVKKAGLPPTVGVIASVGAIFRNRISCNLNCPFIISSTTPCSGGVGRKSGIRHCR